MPEPGLVTITLSGAGNEALIDRVGDDELNPGDALDIPPRSVNLVRALNQINTARGPNRLLELDAVPPAGVDGITGFTHAFNLPLSGALVERAILRLHVTNDVTLADGGVGTRRVRTPGNAFPSGPAAAYRRRYRSRHSIDCRHRSMGE